LLVKEIQTHYRSYGDVRAKPNKANDGDLTVQVFRNKQTKIPVIEIPRNRWVQELVVPELAHFFGLGKVVKINDLTEYIGAPEFKQALPQVYPLIRHIEREPRLLPGLHPELELRPKKLSL